MKTLNEAIKILQENKRKINLTEETNTAMFETKHIYNWNEAKKMIHENPNKYIIYYTYWNQYAGGITGTHQSKHIYIPEFDWSKGEAREFANANGFKNKTKKGRKTPYGEIGAEVREVFIIKGSEFEELDNKFRYFTDNYYLVLNGELKVETESKLVEDNKEAIDKNQLDKYEIASFNERNYGDFKNYITQGKLKDGRTFTICDMVVDIYKQGYNVIEILDLLCSGTIDEEKEEELWKEMEENVEEIHQDDNISDYFNSITDKDYKPTTEDLDFVVDVDPDKLDRYREEHPICEYCGKELSQEEIDDCHINSVGNGICFDCKYNDELNEDCNDIKTEDIDFYNQIKIGSVFNDGNYDIEILDITLQNCETRLGITIECRLKNDEENRTTTFNGDDFLKFLNLENVSLKENKEIKNEDYWDDVENNLCSICHNPIEEDDKYIIDGRQVCGSCAPEENEVEPPRADDNFGDYWEEENEDNIEYQSDIELDKKKTDNFLNENESKTINPEELPVSLRKYAHMISGFEKSNEYVGDKDYWCYLVEPYETDNQEGTIHDTLAFIKSELKSISKKFDNK